MACKVAGRADNGRTGILAMVTQEVEILSPIQTFWLMTLDVVILNWNGRKLLEILLPRVAERSAVKGVTLVWQIMVLMMIQWNG